MSDQSNTWSDERVELLRKLWTEGLSASQIAAELGGVTRNAVIGKVHRLGLSGRAKSAAPAASRPRKAAHTRSPSHPMTQPSGQTVVRGNTALAAAPELETEAVPQEQFQPQDEVVVPLSERVTIMELREAMCRWPMGDPTTPDFRFCGARSLLGMPYCAHHARIAYQPAADRRREKKVMRS
ncbi:GcrA cell cycle regulator [Chelatococcus daeguensis]|uniref:GcrA cell cycle regulator n=2 Tax=Chelatococcus TaxID=28209 RepID=A0AAC9JNT3_9HYPH|nr:MULTISPECIES: GcrA family cell cycle regulator [Chelatococcus]APF36316.1 GcrA cell cycle regulator [Chelatococcus daeguensis]KZE30639.1 GcrA cell cycle regulator [Chelatococcus daeguensis]MBM3082003.1 GcrA cell cycle regulator [Chelatococcus daeguensis]CUA89033.1 Uncharacterized protein Ga0061061_106129 [Chelatococcus sambhunathii]